MADITDDTLRKVLIVALERLSEIEKRRSEDLDMLMAVVRTVRRASPATDECFKAELQARKEKRSADPRSDLSDVYAGLIDLLKRPDPNEIDQQQKLRLLLESFEGPVQ